MVDYAAMTSPRRTRSIAKLAVSEVTGIVIYLIPAILWFYEDLSGAMLMVLYTAESIVTVILAIVCVLLLAPRTEMTALGVYSKTKWSIVTNFLVIASGFSFAVALFVSMFVFLVLDQKPAFDELRFALTLILGFQFLELISNLFLMRPLNLRRAEVFLSESLGGIAMVFLSTLSGMCLAIFVEEWFVVPFLVLYSIIVIGLPIQHFWRDRGVNAQA